MSASALGFGDVGVGRERDIGHAVLERGAHAAVAVPVVVRAREALGRLVAMPKYIRPTICNVGLVAATMRRLP